MRFNHGRWTDHENEPLAAELIGEAPYEDGVGATNPDDVQPRTEEPAVSTTDDLPAAEEEPDPVGKHVADPRDAGWPEEDPNADRGAQ
jgi:hypothetical protein